jgi:hypothetical protein
MARVSWFDPHTNTPLLEEQMLRLEGFTAAMSDGLIEEGELKSQEGRLIDAMREAEPALSDEQHEQVTKLLLELCAYNFMMTMREVQRERMRAAFK